MIDSAERVLCFSEASRTLLRRAYPSLKDTVVEVQPHTLARVPVRATPDPARTTLRIGVVGHISRPKGAAMVSEIADEIARRGLAVEIVVIGSLETEAPGDVVTVIGPYSPPELPGLIERSGANLFLFPSIVPETFSFVTQELIQLGVPLLCFDLGAQAEKVRAYSRGRVVPVMGAPAMLDDLLDFHATLTAQMAGAR